MNRRSYIKKALIFTTSAATSFAAFKWLEFNHPVNQDLILSKRDVLAELVEIIIPATDTPGAKTAMVHDYIINVILNCNTPKQQHRFHAGIEELENYAIDTYKNTFLNCNMDQRYAVLKYFSDNSGYSSRVLNKISNKLLGKPFFMKLRELTIEGYCLSKPGATQGLAYDYIPGAYQSCIPLTLNQKSWATK